MEKLFFHLQDFQQFLNSVLILQQTFISVIQQEKIFSESLPKGMARKNRPLTRLQEKLFIRDGG
jgi:hypothetical protein